MPFTEQLDRIIMAVSPGWGAERVMCRRRHDLQDRAAAIAEKRLETRMERAFDAADNDRFRGHKWMASRLSPNDALDREWTTLVERCEQEYRHNAIARSAVDGRVDNVVGCGIRFQARLKPAEMDDRDADALNRQFEDKFRRWARVVRLPEKQRQFERSKAIYGEAFLVISDWSASEGDIPLVLDVIHPKRVETPAEMEGRENVRLGIEFDERGNPVTYFVRRSHPDDSRGDIEFDRIPAERVFHSFEAVIPGQVRGIPWMAPVLPEMKDLKDFAEAHLIAEQVSACTTAWVKTKNPYQQALGASVASAADGARVEELMPGVVEYIGEMDEVQFSDPNRPGGTFAPYMEWRLRMVAAGLRYPFELLAKVFTNNFSGGRLALIDGRITFRCWQTQSIEDCWLWVGRRFMEECILLGEVDGDPVAYNIDPEPWLRHAWIAPGWPWVDPVKEVQADVLAVNNGLSTETKSLAGRGEDLEETIQERTRELLLHLEADKEVEERRQELAEELGDPNFGREEPQTSAVGTSDDGVGDRSVEEEEIAA